jgi:uncharacterized membrane protein YedE/YeeE
VFILRWRSRFVRNSVLNEGGSWQLSARNRLDLAYIQRRSKHSPEGRFGGNFAGTRFQMTPDLWKSLGGGLLIGAGAATLLLLNGRIAGISGILDNAIRGIVGAQAWRIAFLVGLIVPAAAFGLGAIHVAQGLPLLAVAGLLVGVGTHVGSGCTSGHGVCGMANGSLRSLLATLIFMTSAGVVVFFMRHGAMLWHF